MYVIRSPNVLDVWTLGEQDALFVFLQLCAGGIGPERSMPGSILEFRVVC